MNSQLMSGSSIVILIYCVLCVLLDVSVCCVSNITLPFLRLSKHQAAMIELFD